MSAKAIRRESSGTRRSTLMVCGLLVAIIWAVFGQTLRHDFVNFDDPVYVYQNRVVSSGLTLPNLTWAFVHAHARNWHPLTTISHMLDCQLFGLKPADHHLTNVLLHTVAAVLLFLLLRAMTGKLWPSAFVAAVFAVHPLHVESVAWIAERKDVLSAVFFMLTLGAYVRYARQPSARRYLRMSILFALGLLSKPMLVSVPVVLLLLDYWPLGRFQGSAARNQRSEIRRERSQVRSRWPVARKLIIEKVPLLALSLASSLITLFVQRSNARMDQLPFLWRLNNAIVSHVAYLWQMFWPAKLAVFYPHPNDTLRLWQIWLALLVLAGITAGVIIWRRTRPYLFVGWFWYTIMLLPVIGLIQVGEQARADRYTYLPQIGLYVALSWLIADLVSTFNAQRSTSNAQFTSRRWALGVAAIAIVATLSRCAWNQTRYWTNSESLWTHALAVIPNNDVAHNNLGFLLMRRGELDDALSHFERALQIRSQTAARHYHLGRALIHNNLANALMRTQRTDEAIPHYEQAVALRPDYADARYNFGVALLQQGRVDDAIEQWRKTLSIRPNDAEAHITLANALANKGDVAAALPHYAKALQLAQASGNAALAAKLQDKINELQLSR